VRARAQLGRGAEEEDADALLGGEGGAGGDLGGTEIRTVGVDGDGGGALRQRASA
jgi:hypothetical protein